MSRKTIIAFLLPAFGLLTLVTFFPLLYSVVLAFMRKMPVFKILQFNGLDNFVFLVQDIRFQQSLLTTLKFTFVSVPIELALGLGIALLMREKVPGNALLKFTVMIPWAIPTVVSARMWEWLYNAEYGLFNYFLRLTGLVQQPVNWLGNAQWTFSAIVLADVWKTTPFAALLLYAGLQTIPQELYSAAKIDGANAWKRFLHITFPLLSPVLLIVAVFRTMDAFRIFDLIYVLTGGGPANVTETLSIYSYKLFFQTLQFGYGSAVSVTMFLFIAGLSALYIYILHHRFQALR